VLSHAWEFVTDVRPEHVMKKVLYALDELCGLILRRQRFCCCGVNWKVIDRVMPGLERTELILWEVD